MTENEIERKTPGDCVTCRPSHPAPDAGRAMLFLHGRPRHAADPEIIALPVTAGSSEYLKWLTDSIK